ncbi:MAG: cupin [Flavobacteriaceae bacterium]|jgi:quercetin dioxygenase-like cupin family protein|nr:cupin [Flavobacteriaceae bacterium]MBQ22992.1 cupin [Flavobacteriales bacterium]|tara:strand:- start:12906 stop:13217 length:312 start_codon:yes stop_codon:yes gene_type:complete
MNLKEINSKEVIPGLQGKFIHGNTISLAFWEVKKGALVPNHNHFHEQIMHVIEGRFEFTLNGNTSIYGPGSVVVISSNLFHSGRALTDCKLMDVFSPIREEYR